ncbi:unnamed protein product [Diamesa tonsa]
MSCNYAENLSNYEHKGILGTEEIFEEESVVNEKIEKFVDLFLKSKYIVVHTGAGISTSCGIPDFRGPKGVWTLEKQGIKPKIDIKFENAIPSTTHRALKLLLDKGYIKFIVSQNIDGLHLRSGVARQHLAELHGNMFIEECEKCKKQFIRKNKGPVPTVAKKLTGDLCRSTTRPCRGSLIDTILDWEDDLPERDLDLSVMHSTLADLNIGIGSSFQIMPSGNLPLKNKKFGGKLVICNLQPIKLDKKADLVIHTYVDKVFEKILKRLGIEDIPQFDKALDPTKECHPTTEWTVSAKTFKEVEKLYKDKTSKKGRKPDIGIEICKKLKKTKPEDKEEIKP